MLRLSTPELRFHWRGMGFNKLTRQTLLLPTLLLPRAQQVACFSWVKGRHEFRKLRRADYVIVSFPHSGRTWLRTMLSRYYITKYQIDTMKLIGLNWPHKENPRIPKIFFTHDNHIDRYTCPRNSKINFYDKKVVLLVRDPRDVAVSAYHSVRFRSNPTRYGPRTIYPHGHDPFKHVREWVIRAIRFMNAWQRETDRMEALSRVSYEDLSVAPATHLRRVLQFLGAEPTEAEVADAVEFAAFDNMQKLEREGAFRDDHRLMPQDPNYMSTYKVRRGKVCGYRDYLSEEQVAELDNLVATQLHPSFGYAASRATGLCPR